MSVTLLDKWHLLEAILRDPNLSSTAKVVAARLLGHLNNRSLVCNPSYSTLARGIGLSRARAKAGAQELKRAGWLTIEIATHEQAKGRPKGLPSNSFSFNWRDIPTSEYDPGAEAGSSPGLNPNMNRPRSENDPSPSVRSAPQTPEALNSGKNTGRGTKQAPRGAAALHRSSQNSDKPSLVLLTLEAGEYGGGKS